MVDPTLAFLYRRHSGSDSSVKALDGRRFDEERALFTAEAQEFTRRGWDRAARAARRHLTSRTNALTTRNRCPVARSMSSAESVRSRLTAEPTVP